MQDIDHSENIIEVRDVSFSYNGHDVLRDVTLDVHRGDYLAIVGGNGSGKTTLVRIILGLLVPKKGSVRLFNTNVANFKDWKKIGYVRQHATNVDRGFPSTVFEVVLMGRFALRGLLQRVTAGDRQEALRALDEVGLTHLKDVHINVLSGGQLQRVLIARALAGEPEILFLDEPTVGVDADTKASFYELLRKLNRERKLTVVLITHDVESIAHEAMHIACVDCRVFFHKSYEEYLGSDVHHVRGHEH
jgi:zinc transport system ATP-binding protein